MMKDLSHPHICESLKKYLLCVLQDVCNHQLAKLIDRTPCAHKHPEMMTKAIEISLVTWNLTCHSQALQRHLLDNLFIRLRNKKDVKACDTIHVYVLCNPRSKISIILWNQHPSCNLF